MKSKLISVLLIIFFCENTFAQVYSDKVVGAKNEELIDSIKNEEYPYILPIWGAKVAARGYDLPYSAGVSVNYLTQESALILNNLLIGFNNGPMVNLDEIVRFNDAQSWAGGLTVRPDIWLLPFLNVYGLLGRANSSTEINAGVYLPNLDNEWQEISTISTKANFTAQIMGIGMTPTIGIGGGWMALDMNCAWSDVDALDKPVFTFVFGPRFGKTFRFKKPQQNIAFWVGGFRVQFSSDTKGSINLSEVVNTDEIQIKVDQGTQKVEETQVAVDAWWTGLTPLEQKNPVNVAKYNTANRALETAGNFYNAADAALNDGKSATVQYSLEKNLKDKWNFIVGSQYQLNKHWMLRAEYGFLGSRTQFMTSLQYRFRL